MDVKIEKFDPLKVAYMRHHGPYETCHETWLRFNQWCLARKAYGPDILVIGVSWDDPEKTPPEKIRYDCCITVDDDFEPDDQVQVQALRGGDFASFTLKGSYTQIAPAFRKLFTEWLPQSGYEYEMAPCWEIYRTDPGKTPEDENITDILIPIK